MRPYKKKSQFLILFLFGGFLTGIVYANLISGHTSIINGTFNEHFLKQYAQTEIIAEEYLWYIVRVRLLPLLCVCLLGCAKWKKLLVGSCIGWTGFSGGVVAVSSVMALGIKGIFLCIVGMMPQMFFYGFTYIILLWHFYHFPLGRWNLKKTIVVSISMAVGVILEVYANPVLMKMMVQLL